VEGLLLGTIPRTIFGIILAGAVGALPASAQQSGGAEWRFFAAGDSRNCGDVVMPAIAESAKRNQAEFFWHLGDLRAISAVDEDIQHQPEHLAKPLSITEYEAAAWPDFIDSQIAPFGSIPFYVGIGNHETTATLKTREGFLTQFADWLDTPALRAQRLQDDPKDHRLKAYFHWIHRGVAFYSLDNATLDQIATTQIGWFEGTLAKDLTNPAITTIVAGMHKPLPESLSGERGMQESATGTESGRRIYADLLRAQNEARKRVYVLAGHAHYFMDGIFNSEYWKQHGGVLPGWIAGTSGAVRYELPDHAADARRATTNVYGVLIGTVLPGGEIRFTFQEVKEAEIPDVVLARYGREFVHWCFEQNTQAKQ
jgi:calcineurin-like phosphoesterase family protein